MSVKATIDAADNWFVGEAKVLRFTVVVPEDTDDFTDWEVRYRLIGSDGDVLVEKTTTDNVIVLSEVTDNEDPPNIVARHATVQILAADTEDLAPRTYQHNLWRTDAGNEAVLAYGDVVLRDSEDT